MSLLRFDPKFSNLESLLDYLEKIPDSRESSNKLGKNYESLQISYDQKVVSNDKETLIYFNIPGMRAEDLSLRVVEGNLLHIKYTPAKEAIFVDKGALNTHYRGLAGKDISNISSEYRDGVLKIVIPHAPKSMPQDIKVKFI